MEKNHIEACPLPFDIDSQTMYISVEINLLRPTISYAIVIASAFLKLDFGQTLRWLPALNLWVGGASMDYCGLGLAIPTHHIYSNLYLPRLRSTLSESTRLVIHCRLVYAQVHPPGRGHTLRR